MELKNILINIGNYDDTINIIFPNKDLISIEDLLDMLEEQYYENQRLLERIEDLENKEEPDDYDAWHDQQLEEGVI